MDHSLWLYVAGWSIACALALAVFVVRGRRFAITQRDYWRFLAQPWKLVTFAIAALAIVIMAPYTGDPTWDHIDGGFMSMFAFTTAPWAIATVYRTLRGRVSIAETYAAVCVWLFSASWSYDLYLLLRDGEYPVTWFANLFASSVIYAAAGMMWNLEWVAGRGVIFAFMRDDWPSANPDSRFAKLVWMALPFMAIVALAFAYFLAPLPVW